MTRAERVLYHQIHPAKLLVDWLAGLVAAALLWHHHLTSAFIVGLLPPVCASAILINDHFEPALEHYRTSAFGRYVARHMTRGMQALRLVGLVLLWWGSWHQRLVVAALGLIVVLVAWARGFWWPRRDSAGATA